MGERPSIRRGFGGDSAATAWIEGSWTSAWLPEDFRGLRRAVSSAARSDVLWEMRSIRALDHIGALVLWECWGRHLPPRLLARDEHLALFGGLDRGIGPLESARESRQRGAARPSTHAPARIPGRDIVLLLGQLVLEGLASLARPRRLAWRELSATVYHAGVRALGVTALVGFLVGIVVSYLSALELRRYGAGVYVVNLLGLGIIRELGPLLAAIIVAGRSGSSITAQLGVMRLTQELDALATFGVSHAQRLVLPRVLGLMVVMPLLTVWTELLALLGGMLSARISLQIGYGVFLGKLPAAVPFANFSIGLLKAVVFGATIGFVATTCGERILPNAESLGRETTNSVVVAITLVIVLDAIFAVAFQHVGLSAHG